MRIYAVGTVRELAELSEFCRANKWEFVPLKGAIGRPKVDHPVQKIMDAYQTTRTVRGVARMLDIPAPTVWRVLKQAGALEGDLRSQQKEHEEKDGD